GGEWLDDQELAAICPPPALGLGEWLVTEPTTSMPGLTTAVPSAAHGGHEHGHHARFTPFQRLVGLLQGEKRDIGAIFVFAIVVGVLTLTTPIAVEALVNTVAFGGLFQPLIVLAIMLCAFMGFSSLVRGIQTYVVEIIQRRVFVRVAADLAYRLPRVRRDSLDGEYGPELANRFFDVVTVQKVVAMLLLDGIGIVLQAFIGMLVLAFYHPVLLAFDVVLLVSIIFVIFGLGYGAVRASIEESRAKYAIADWLEQLAGLPGVFRGAGGGELARGRADQLTAQYVLARKSHFRIVMRQIASALALQAVVATALLGLGGWLVIAGQLTLGQLVAAELIVSAIVGTFAKLGKHLESYYDLLTSLDKLGHLFDLPLDPMEGDHLHNAGPAAVRAQNLAYSYHEGHEVIHSKDLEIEGGERLGLVGPPGSGKSTLLQLLAGWREPGNGRIELDEHDMRDLHPEAISKQVRLVRRAEVFTGSILENVQAHRRNVTQHEVRGALKSVGLLEELLSLPDGLNTHLMQGGSPLTDSQTCRLTLARALCGGPRLLLIDGLLDSLAGDCGERALDAVFDDARQWTVVLVTSRPEFLSRCDRTLRLTLGRVTHVPQSH
ncbi:MAG: peptidase domain-containing ABC transporter, partial [Pirellulales bacterium]